MFVSGRIEVVCGPMFSGKTEELIRRVRRAQIARQKIQIFKPSIDDRFHKTNIVSHSASSVEAMAVDTSFEILQKVLDSTRIVAIDEVQFFDNDIIKVIRKLARRGIRVLCAGLDQDYRGDAFGPMGELLCIADSVDKVHAICTICGQDATKSYRKLEGNPDQVLVGEAESYEARCRNHFDYYGESDEMNSFMLGLRQDGVHSQL